MFAAQAPKSSPGYNCAGRKNVSFLFGNDHFESKRNEESGLYGQTLTILC